MASPQGYKASSFEARQKSRELVARLRAQRLAKKPPLPAPFAPSPEPECADAPAPIAPLTEALARFDIEASGSEPDAPATPPAAAAPAMPAPQMSRPFVEAIAEAIERTLAAKAEPRLIAPEASPPAPISAKAAPAGEVDSLPLLREVIAALVAAEPSGASAGVNAAAETAPHEIAHDASTPEPALTEPSPAEAIVAAAPAPAAQDPAVDPAPETPFPHLPLERLTMLGPGLRWRLAQLGYATVDALAEADADALRARLGEIGRLANVRTWLEAAQALRAAERR